MPNYKRIIQLSEQNISQRRIEKEVHSSRHTIGAVLDAAKLKNIRYRDIADLSDEKIEELLGVSFSRTGKENRLYEMPDYEYCARELKKPGVTIKMIWEEYCQDCLRSGKIPYRLTQFKKYLREYIDENEFTDIIAHKPGESIEVDWAGTRPYWFDPCSGEKIEGYLFVGVLSYSGYGYCEVTADMKEESWINCHIHMFDFFEGVSRFLIPDNLKTGVTSHPKEGDIILNRYYEEMAEHYGIAILPARVLRPKDKPLSENMVKQYTREVIGRLRNMKFFSMEEYNAQALKKVNEFNAARFQKKEGSRRSRFEEERDYLSPLPVYPYEFALWKKAKVQTNSHVAYGKKFYSVPYEYIGNTVDLRISGKSITVYYEKVKLCSHPLLSIKDPLYSTNPEHMPKGSNAYEQWNRERFIKWANRIGVFTTTAITDLFAQYAHEQQAYNGAKSILLLADRYSPERLEKACEIALKHLTRVRYRDINGILKNKHDLGRKQEERSTAVKTTEHSPYLRGSSYYRGGDHD